MDPERKQPQSAQPADSAPRSHRKSHARISPRSLSPLTRQLVVEEFVACGDMDEVAHSYHLPVRTVDSILHWFSLRKQPSREVLMMPARRIA